MTERILIRPAQLEDALCLGVLGTQIFLDTYATDGIRPAIAHTVLASFSTGAMSDLLQQSGTRLLVAERDRHLLGFAQITIGTRQELVHTPVPAELGRLYVQAGFAGQGLGSALLRAAETFAATHQASALWLTCWVGNQRALGFYRQHAYVDVGLTTFQMEGEMIANRVLQKPLSLS
jgi:ribosomal protein S18 acetylase RimI-like enzyme